MKFKSLALLSFLLLELGLPNAAYSRSVGEAYCYSTRRPDDEQYTIRSRVNMAISKATIEPNGQGFTMLISVNEVGDTVFKLDQRLVIQSASGEFEPYDNTQPVAIKPTGSFSVVHLSPGGPRTCGFEGTITFLGGAKEQIFGSGNASRSPRRQTQNARVAQNGVLRLGDRGSQVYRLIEDLRCAGYYRVGNDSYFGPVTERAVIAFQRDRGLLADGIAGPQTQKLLRQIRSRRCG
jgi:hypothetical protein